MAKKVGEFDGKAALKLFWKMQPAVIDEAELRNVFGHLVSTSFDDVARVFGTAAATVRNTWRRDGMPVISAHRGVGCKVSLVEVLIWLLKRGASTAASRNGNEYTNRKQEAETRAAEAVALIKERKAEVVTGEYTPTSVAVSVVNARANLLRDRLMGIEREIKPMLPAKYASQCIEEINRFIRHALTSFSESSLSDLEDAIKEGTENDV